MRIVVTGLIASYPFGGVFWDYFQYVLGFHRLGHDVLYLEDTGKWCYWPAKQTFIADGRRNAAYLYNHIRALDAGLADRWFFRDGGTKTEYGIPWPEVVQFCRTADLFLNISASCWMREEYFEAECVAFLDSDPMYTQAGYSRDVGDKAKQWLARLREYDVLLTFAENIGAPDCRVPTGSLNWRPTRQPIVLDAFETARVPVNERRRVLTTVASWEPNEDGPTIDGVNYTGKSTEFRRFIHLPGRAGVLLELAMSGRCPAQELISQGWRLIDPLKVSHDPWTYRRYLADSLGEWSVAKNAYTASRSGWFSCRSACYLGLGVPVIVQDTVFGDDIPVDRGVLKFSTPDEAVAAIKLLLARPEEQAQAAVDVAAECFDARKVLPKLLDTISEASTTRETLN